MSRSSSPAVPWEHLATWLEAITDTGRGDLEQLSQEQLDTELDKLMAHDPTQSYAHKDLVKILGSLAHNLIAQARLSEKSYTDLEREAATLKLQAQEARRDQNPNQRRLDPLLLETEKEDETDTEQEKEVERLQKTLEDLRLDAAHREKLEKDARKELNEKLRRGESLLERANTELKERDAKTKAYEKHLQSAQAEINELVQQRHELKDELDTVQRELRQSYKLQRDRQGETHNTEFPLTNYSAPFSQEPRTAKGGDNPLFKMSPASLHEFPSAAEEREPFQEARVNSHVASKGLDKLARNVPTFSPDPAGGHDVHAYLKDIDFHLQTVANANNWDRLYLLRITSNREVRSFLDRQPETVKADYKQLRQALIREYSDLESDQGLIAAVDLRQGRLETPQNFYNRLRRAYFGARNEPGMEEDVNFRTLFLRNLHSTISHHLGVLACPRSMNTQQLRDLAHKAYLKQRTISEKTVKPPTICPVSEHRPELALEGAQQNHSYSSANRDSKPLPASRGQFGRGEGRPRHQNDHSERSWDQPRPFYNQKGVSAWEASQQPRRNRTESPRSQSPESWRRGHSRRDTGKLRPEPVSNKETAAASEAAELLKALKEFLQKNPRKEDKKDEPGTA